MAAGKLLSQDAGNQECAVLQLLSTPTHGINGDKTTAYYLPGEDATIIAFVTSQIQKPALCVTTAV
jgi:hypothetical protein